MTTSPRRTLGSGARRTKTPMAFARVLLLLCLGTHALGQTFQYSRGWTNGRKRSFAETALAEDGRKEDATQGQVLPASIPETGFPEDLSVGPRGAEGRELSRADQGRLEALLVVLGGSKEMPGAEGLDMEALRQKAVQVAANRRRGAWRRSSLNEIFLRRRRRRSVETQTSRVN